MSPKRLRDIADRIEYSCDTFRHERACISCRMDAAALRKFADQIERSIMVESLDQLQSQT